MRTAVVALILVAGCTRKNGDLAACTPGEQRQCACLGGEQGIQLCNAGGIGLGECLGCPGGPQLDLATGSDLASSSVQDLAFSFDFPPGTDLTGFNPFPDLNGLDLSVPPDFSVPQDMSVAEPPDLAHPGVPCPVVMLVLDQSGSMDINFPDVDTTHMQAAKAALGRLVNHYGARVPFGLTTFEATLACTDGINVAVEPAFGSATAVKSGIAAAMSGGSTNTGNAMSVVAANPKMHDPQRQGSFVVLVTDGAANCEQGDPTFAAGEIDKMAKAAKPIKTYVVGIDLFSSDLSGVELEAKAGQQKCQGGFCDGHSYYPADSETQLDKALDLVLNDLVKGCGNFACFPSGAACTNGTSCCGTVGCKNLQNDPENCGQCGTVCRAGSCNQGVCPPVDMLPPPDLLPAPDLFEPDLGECSCDHACSFGCVAHNCCFEDTLGAGGCVATPNLCACSGLCF